MNNITKFWFLKDFDLFQKMGQKNLLALSELLEMVHVKKGETLQLTHDDKRIVYFIKTGVVKIVSHENEQTISILKAGNIFGELDLYVGNLLDLNEEKAIVLTDSVVCLIEAKQMKTMLENHSSLKNQLLKLQGLKIRRLKRNLEELLYKDSETRIKEFLFKFIREFGIKSDGLITARNLISHKDIAHLTNTSRQTVSNVLSKLRKDGVINYNSNELMIILRENK